MYVLLFFREKGVREGNISVWLPLGYPLLGTWPTTQACALTGNQTGDPLVRKQALIPPSHTSQESLACFNVPRKRAKQEAGICEIFLAASWFTYFPNLYSQEVA